MLGHGVKRSYDDSNCSGPLLDPETLDGWLCDIQTPEGTNLSAMNETSNISNGGRSQLAFIEGYLAGQASFASTDRLPNPPPDPSGDLLPLTPLLHDGYLPSNGVMPPTARGVQQSLASSVVPPLLPSSGPPHPLPASEIDSSCTSDEVQSLVSSLPAQYAQTTTLQQQIMHVRMLRELRNGTYGDVLTSWVRSRNTGVQGKPVYQLCITFHDR